MRSSKAGGKPAVYAAVCLLALAAVVEAIGGQQQACDNTLLQQMVDETPSGGVLIIEQGRYCGPIVIRKTMTLKGVGYPVIDGDYRSDVVVVEADNVTISGLKIINSNPDISMEAAGIKVKGDNSRITGNVVTNALFPVYLLKSRNTVVENNTLESFANKDINERGHGIYLWYTFNTSLINNRITNSKDGIYNEHAYNTTIKGNIITRSRYGMHLMYSYNYTIADNIVSHNLVGLALMFSYNLYVANNIVKENKGEAVSEGVFLRESGNVTVERNLIYGHVNGFVIEYSPYPPRMFQLIRNNTVAFNYIGVWIDGQSGGVMYANNFVENLQQIVVVGERNPSVTWTFEGVGNYWSDYRGLGDVPHKVENPLEDIMDGFPQLRIFIFSPAYYALETMKKAFPFNPRVRAVDEKPLAKPSHSYTVNYTRDNWWALTAALLTIISVFTVYVAGWRGFVWRR
ncbi:MAG: nitrous oxide reductase family maturation protein NosD [Candidatus Caldarchaeum sp.]|uniref:Nitrous oxide reductase family maturation protein NosD n=1 Tax=Caldiarchaeum subterraneum TaxID=311458 RepID=A0A7C5LB74_CALS0